MPIFNDTPTNLTYHKGDRAILQCSVNNLGTKQVIKRGLIGHCISTWYAISRYLVKQAELGTSC